MKNIQTQREQEKQMVSQMIALYCRVWALSCPSCPPCRSSC